MAALLVPAIACGGDEGDDGNNGNNPDAAQSADAAANADAAAVDACMSYCTNALANCTGANVLYTNMAECTATCAAMPEGAAADQAGNTAFCRAYHAGDPAESMAAVHCPHAAATSDSDVCGTLCDAYCDQVMANCQGADAQYADRGQCETACALMPTGAYNDTTGDTVQCRTYHASFPAAGMPGVHCSHAGVDGDGVCADPAAN